MWEAAIVVYLAIGCMGAIAMALVVEGILGPILRSVTKDPIMKRKLIILMALCVVGWLPLVIAGIIKDSRK